MAYPSNTHSHAGAPLPSGPSSSARDSSTIPGASSALITYARQLNEAESNLLLTGEGGDTGAVTPTRGNAIVS
jgi:hypothetical protein